MDKNKIIMIFLTILIPLCVLILYLLFLFNFLDFGLFLGLLIGFTVGLLTLIFIIKKDILSLKNSKSAEKKIIIKSKRKKKLTEPQMLGNLQVQKLHRINFNKILTKLKLKRKDQPPKQVGDIHITRVQHNNVLIFAILIIGVIALLIFALIFLKIFDTSI